MCKKKETKALTPEQAAEHARAQRFLFEQGRRRFLSNMASGTLGTVAALSAGPRGWYAWADSQGQQAFMINIHMQGGWDSNWFHMAFPKSKITTAIDNPNLITNMPASQYDAALPKPGDPGITAGSDPLARVVDVDGNGAITQFYHGHYTERTKSDLLLGNSQYQHPTASGHYYGVGLLNAFAYDTSLFSSKTCILKGLYSGGAHTIPNKVVLHGSESQYAISYSGLISAALAQRQGKRKLHYMQLSETPGQYGSNWAMAKGDQVPINCPDHSSFKKLIQRADDEFSNATAYSSINESVQKLGDQISRNKFSLAQSKTIYKAFMDNFRSALVISELSTQMGGFLAIWAEYANYALSRLSALHSNSFLGNVSPELALTLKGKAYNTHTFAPYKAGVTTREGTILADNGASNPPGMYQSVVDSYSTALSTPFTADEASLNLSSGTFIGTPAAFRTYVAQSAWKFAIAEYLITQGHSTVVDMTFSTGDMHMDNPNELRNLTLIYALYSKLISRLNSAQVPGMSASYLDRTLVTMFSEFDRTAGILTDSSKDNRGTGHDLTESVLFTGFGINQNTVVGDRLYGGLAGAAPLTYQPGKTQVIDFKYVFPTIMKIFNVEIPAQQITDSSYIAPVIAGL